MESDQSAKVHLADRTLTLQTGAWDHLVLQNAGPDPDGFLRFFTTELGPRVRALTPSEDSPAAKGPGLVDRLRHAARS